MTFECAVCEKIFTKSAKLNEHMRYHSNFRPFKCEYDGCGKAYFKHYHLKRHVVLSNHVTRDIASNDAVPIDSINSSSTRSNTLTCTYINCKYTCLIHEYMQKHIKKHHKQPFKCIDNNCSETFKTEYLLNRHYKIHHENIKPISCVVCTKRFNYNSELKKHIKTHKEYYKCDEDVVYGCMHKLAANDEDVFDKNSTSISTENRIIIQKKSILLHFIGFICFLCDKVYKCRKYLNEHYSKNRCPSINRKTPSIKK